MGLEFFNAALALNIDARKLTENVDSVMFCLSKGLSAPIGSILAGTSAFISEARRIRKRLGGGMRQAGILAAAGIVALEKMVNRLVDDNKRARDLAIGLEQIPGIHVDLDIVQTNIVLLSASDLQISSEQLVRKMEESGVKVSYWPPHQARMVVHRHISDQDIKTAIDVVRRLATATVL